jgi:hypothetical protein
MVGCGLNEQDHSRALAAKRHPHRHFLFAQCHGERNHVLSSAARLAAVGCGLGLLGAVAASRLLRSFLFEVSPFDPGVLAFSVIAMLLLALIASALPARRASSTDPMLALRGE